MGDGAIDNAADVVRVVVSRHGLWMTWNTFLALVPLGLALLLFHRTSRAARTTLLVLAALSGPAALAGAALLWSEGSYGMIPLVAGGLVVVGVALLLDRAVLPERPWLSPLWWGGVVLFVLFLPNAPYVLTDLIHLITDIDSGLFSRRAILGILVPLFAAFCFIGVEAYTLSLLSVRGFLSRAGLTRWSIPVEVTLHAVCAVGIFMGRQLRFNSWDAFHDPYAVASTSAERLTQQEGVVFVAGMFATILVLYTALKLVHLELAALGRRVRAGRHARHVAVAIAA
jgi:uncharacterized membrane protein